MNHSVRHVPIWFPGAYFRRLGKEVYDITERIRTFAFGLVEQDVVRVRLFLFLRIL